MSQIITLGSIKYLIGSIPVAVIKGDESSKNNKAVAVTVLDVQDLGAFDSTTIQSALQALEDGDDVMNDSFTGRILFKDAKATHPTPLDTGHEALKHPYFQADLPCPGPYFLADSKLHNAFRLYEDTYSAFMCGVVPTSSDRLSFEEGSSGLIPVPSRHYYPTPSDSFPLSGLRVAVKDIYDLEGVKTTAGSKAYASMQEPAAKTAECIERLIDLGAIVIGKTKTVQFASGMTPADWEDYPCPINARGDEQLDPACSSAGSGAAIAAYEWLDFAVGSDTLGSMTGPSSACGVFGMRPSIGLLSSVGGLPVSVHLDTPGHFSRSLPLLLTIATSWLTNDDPLCTSDDTTNTSPPRRLLVPADCFAGYIPSKLSAMRSFSNMFAVDLKPDETNVEDWWKISKYNPDPSKPLVQFLATTVATIQLHDCCKNNLPFRKDYEVKNGTPPKVDRLIQFKWDLGANITSAEYAKALAEREVFRDFLYNDIFTEGTIMLLPNGNHDLAYRDVPSLGDEGSRAWQGFGFQNTAFSVLGGLPAVSVPIGERTYLSKFTHKAEKQPISMMVLGPPKSDLWLLRVVESAFISSERPLEVLTGSSIYDPRR